MSKRKRVFPEARPRDLFIEHEDTPKDDLLPQENNFILPSLPTAASFLRQENSTVIDVNDTDSIYAILVLLGSHIRAYLHPEQETDLALHFREAVYDNVPLNPIPLTEIAAAYQREPIRVRKQLSVEPLSVYASLVAKGEYVPTMPETNGISVPWEVELWYLLPYAQQVAASCSMPALDNCQAGRRVAALLSPEFIRDYLYRILPTIIGTTICETHWKNKARSLQRDMTTMKNRAEENANVLRLRLEQAERKAETLEAALKESRESAAVAVRNATVQKDAELNELRTSLEDERKKYALEHSRVKTLTRQQQAHDENWRVEDLEPLPDRGVFVVGGHENWVSKLKEVHPQWSYYTDGACVLFPRSPQVIIFFTGHMSHSTFAAIKSRYRTQKPLILYVQSINQKKLEDELKLMYHQALLACSKN